MSITKDPVTGRRSVEISVDVPGTVEEVWEAIATGPGVSSWFAPTVIAERDGDKYIQTTIAPGMVVEAKETLWDPPRRFIGEASMGPNAPVLAAEWSVEAKDGSTCTVRVVNSLFSSTDDWDNQLIGTESGWPSYFRVLELYLAHFKGMPSAVTVAMHMGAGDPAEAWARMRGALPVQGVIEHEDPNQVFLRITEPCPGVARAFARPMGPGKMMTCLGLYLYGSEAKAIAERMQAETQQWVTAISTTAEAAAAS